MYLTTIFFPFTLHFWPVLTPLFTFRLIVPESGQNGYLYYQVDWVSKRGSVSLDSFIHSAWIYWAVVKVQEFRVSQTDLGLALVELKFTACRWKNSLSRLNVKAFPAITVTYLSASSTFLPRHSLPPLVILVFFPTSLLGRPFSCVHMSPSSSLFLPLCQPLPGPSSPHGGEKNPPTAKPLTPKSSLSSFITFSTFYLVNLVILIICRRVLSPPLDR